MELLDQQIKVLESKKRTVALVGGTGFGKTWLGPHWLFDRMRKKPGSRYMGIGMQYERHVINVMQKELTGFFDKIREPYKLVTGRRMQFPRLNNSELLFGSAEKPESLEGPHLDGGVWMDEAGYMTSFAYEVAMRRSGMRDAQVYISTIPYLPGWLKQQVYEPWTKGDPDIDWIHCRTIDNPRYSLKELLRAKRSLRPDKFMTHYMGEFARPFGAIYPTPEDEELVFDWEVDFPEGIPDDWPCFVGHDWGWNAPTTGVWGRLDTDNDILYVVAEYEHGEMTLEDHLGEWRSLGLDAIDLGFGDPANPEQWQNATNKGYPVNPAENAVNYGINCVWDRMNSVALSHKGQRSRRLRIARGLHALFDYRARYVWDTDPKDENVLLDKPKKPQEAEHLMDALRYLCVGIVEEGVSPGPAFAMAGSTWSPKR